MSKYNKILQAILSGLSDSNIEFQDLRNLLIRFGFNERVKGGHHIYSKPDIEEIINLQPKSSKAKQYQVRQVRNIILKYKLGDLIDE